MTRDQGEILVVDDEKMNRMMMARSLEQQGHHVTRAEDGQEALDLLHAQPFDVVLLDILMPGMDGYAVLEAIKQDPELRHIPVIMISALEEIESVVRCIEMGADDYMTKPFDPVLLQARINASLSKKRLHDLEQAYIKLLQAEQERSERLLLNVLPKPVAERLKQDEKIIADSFDQATVLFADIVDFTPLAVESAPDVLVDVLNQIFSAFDLLAERYGAEKIKTFGDAYMAVAGVPVPRPGHLEAIADLALAMQAAITGFRRPDGRPFQLRIGVSTGSVVAGVIGTKKFVYDLWGDPVNIASRMESQGVPGAIQVTEAVYALLGARYHFEVRGVIDVKGKGEMMTYLLLGKHDGA